MKSVIVAYVKDNEINFENTIPLQFVGKRNLSLGYSNDIYILFSQGYELLSPLYRDSLKDLGFHIYNVTDIYSKIDVQYPGLNALSQYEKNTFLQWLLMYEFFQGDPIIHYDGDIVFNEDPAIIAQKVKGKTFILQGCPAFTPVSDRQWFEQYKSALNEFCKNISEYSQRAWQQRNGWDVTFRTRWAGGFFRPLLRHDQDLMSHLIHTNQLKQNSIEDIMLCLKDYILCENPLFLHSFEHEFPYHYKRENGVDYLYFQYPEDEVGQVKKKVLFWHMQNCFNFYLAKYIFRKRFLPFKALQRLPLHLRAQGWEDALNKKANRLLHHTNRLNVYRYFFDKHDFSGIMNDRTWWKKGIFE